MMHGLTYGGGGTTSTLGYLTLTSTTSTSQASVYVNPANVTTGQAFNAVSQSSLNVYQPRLPIHGNLKGGYSLKDGTPLELRLPDGSLLDVKADGSFEVTDASAKITYRANRIRDFNSFINASDKIENFIQFCGESGVRQGEMLHLPLHLFIKWLVTEAAKADQEPPRDVGLLPDLRKHIAPKCVSCGRFIRRELTRNKLEFCGPPCFERRFRLVETSELIMPDRVLEALAA